MTSKILHKTTADGFRVSYLADAGTDWLGLFEKLRANLDSGQPPAWMLLQRSAAPGKFLRRTWKVDCEDQTVVFKAEQILRPWSLERVLRMRKMRAAPMQERIERAHASGFTFPMRISLTAERYKSGMLRERFLICEFINGKDAGRKRDRDVVAAIRRAHEFGLCWGGDPDPCGGNILEDSQGNLRGVDISPLRATWRERGKDLDFLYNAGILSGKLPLSVRIARIQAAVKKLFRKTNRK